MPPSAVEVMSTESCDLTLSYAAWHTAANVVLLLGLVLYGRTEFCFSAHVFGLFALLADYGCFYLHAGTRTIELVDAAEGDSLGSGTVLLFFLWYDHFGAFGLVVWAQTLTAWLDRQLTAAATSATPAAAAAASSLPGELFVLLHQPLLFWTAPVLAPIALGGWDDRVIRVSRPSPKMTYYAILVFVVGLLRRRKTGSRPRLRAILAAGLGCGLVHHAALFAHGMRGYSTLPALVLTLASEWPALIATVAFLRSDAVPSISSREAGRRFMWAIIVGLVACLLPHLNDDNAAQFLIPNVPGQHMQSIGTLAFRATTCVLPQIKVLAGVSTPLNCRADGDNSTWVLATPAKSGALLSAKLLMDLGAACNLCVASGERSRAGIPGPEEELPTYDGDILHGIINMRSWPEYAASRGDGTARCVSIIRDPLARLKSLYLYARSGGEQWFISSGIAHMLQLGDSRELGGCAVRCSDSGSCSVVII